LTVKTLTIILAVMVIQNLGYLGIGTPDPEQWAAFARDVIGLGVEPGDPGETTRYRLRMDQHPFRFWLEDGPAGGVTVVGWEVRNPSSIEEMTMRLKGAGIDVTSGTVEECDHRQVTRMVHFAGPGGLRNELFCGRRLAERPFVSPLGVEFVTEEQGLGHLVLQTAQLQDAVDFYCDVLGFRFTDTVESAVADFTFLGCNSRHHSLAFTPTRKREGTHHILCEVKTSDDVGRALDRVRQHRVPLLATLGRHSNDGMFSFYMSSPADFGVEIGSGGVQVDERTWVSRTYTADIWGHHPG
jgi:3,4-dihydroxy-9,10-secoandrosta-1,3,5(10)-triene-9,17-dione 4,5-dioxygenase